jgi:hypothetical protein
MSAFDPLRTSCYNGPSAAGRLPMSNTIALTGKLTRSAVAVLLLSTSMSPASANRPVADNMAFAQAQTPSSQRPDRAPDLADAVEGSYAGSVISDARGSSRSDVNLVVKRVGRNTVHVSSDYPRLPEFKTELTRAMHTIQTTGTEVVFLFDRSKQPPSLDITVDDASWSGVKQ